MHCTFSVWPAVLHHSHVVTQHQTADAATPCFPLPGAVVPLEEGRLALVVQAGSRDLSPARSRPARRTDTASTLRR